MKGPPIISPRHLVRRFSPALFGPSGADPLERPERDSALRRWPNGWPNRWTQAWPHGWQHGWPHGWSRRRLRGEGEGPVSLGRIGDLEVRLATCESDVRRAQALRYRVFYEEMSAVPDALTLSRQRDADSFDPDCDHLLVVDHAIRSRGALRNRPAIVGTYRLLRQDVAARRRGFYTAGEYEIGPLIRSHPSLNFLELGRSCVLAPYRNKRTVELLWHGIWAYVLAHRVDVLFGCASLEGTDPERLALPLSFLHHHARAAGEWRVSALPHRHVEMNRMPADAIDAKAALCALPPLIKGYLRLGAQIGDGAVIDRQFGTTDVCIVLPKSAISPRYINYYGAGAERHKTHA
jgi:putative hemolysin